MCLIWLVRQWLRIHEQKNSKLGSLERINSIREANRSFPFTCAWTSPPSGGRGSQWEIAEVSYPFILIHGQSRYLKHATLWCFSSVWGRVKYLSAAREVLAHVFAHHTFCFCFSVKEFLEKAKEDFEEKWKNPSKVSVSAFPFYVRTCTCFLCVPLLTDGARDSFLSRNDYSFIQIHIHSWHH